jgi:hypothetical protein
VFGLVTSIDHTPRLIRLPNLSPDDAPLSIGNPHTKTQYLGLTLQECIEQCLRWPTAEQEQSCSNAWVGDSSVQFWISKQVDHLAGNS